VLVGLVRNDLLVGGLVAIESSLTSMCGGREANSNDVFIAKCFLEEKAIEIIRTGAIPTFHKSFNGRRQ
jgi:hypothetical protein